MKSVLLGISLLLSARLVCATALPGFRAERLGATSGFATSIAIDSKGTIHYTTVAGDLFRFVAGQSQHLAHVETDPVGNAGLLGMALIDDRTAVVHYTTPNQTHDVVSWIDLETAAETVLQTFVADISFPGRPTPSEHHGGNPIVADDGSIFLGIGDYGGYAIAALPEWNAGKILRIDGDGNATQFARGLRNPYDMVWDAANQRLILSDNGPFAGDEIHVITAGAYCGWPYTVGTLPAIDGAVPPVYVFPDTVAPTGMTALSGLNTALPRGYLVGAFVTRAIYYFPDLDIVPVPDPKPLIEGETGFVIDVAEAPNGEIFFVTWNAVYRLLTPARGDCDGDAKLGSADLNALMLELGDGDSHPAIEAQHGAHAGSWGCDADGDGLISSSDLSALARLLSNRARAVRGR